MLFIIFGQYFFIRFGSQVYRQIVGFLMGTNCPPLVANLFLFCYERDFLLSFLDNNQTAFIEAFNYTSRYLMAFLILIILTLSKKIDERYPTELQLTKSNSSDDEAPFLDLDMSISNGIVSSKIYDKWDQFYLEIVNFAFNDGDVSCSLPMMYISSYDLYI